MWAPKPRFHHSAGFPLTHTCANFTLKNRKGRTLLLAQESLRRTRTSYYPYICSYLCNNLGNPACFINPPLCLIGEYVHPTLFKFFSPRGRNQHILQSSIGQKKNWCRSSEVFQTQKDRMKCKTCLDANGCLAKPPRSTKKISRIVHVDEKSGTAFKAFTKNGSVCGKGKNCRPQITPSNSCNHIHTK